MAIQKFSNRVLDGLGGEYGIIGSVSRTDSLDVSPPVLVHDVSENVRAMSWIPVAAEFSLNSGAPSTTVFSELTRAQFFALPQVISALAELRLSASEVDIWVEGVQGAISFASSGNFATGALGVSRPQGPGIASFSSWLASFNGVGTQTLISGGDLLLTQADDQRPTQRFPFLLADRGAMSFFARLGSDAGGAAVAQYLVFCLVGPKGSIPPL